ncbi:iron-sulfur cluster assembly scaffold protein [Microgenomates group bacterium]|nr:iron-sulfur cluster assembly scaffold protein [Microgenomates group bacterium]
MSNLSYDFYTPEVLTHFNSPHNAGILPDADVSGEVGNVVCGDMMKIYLKIEEKNSDYYIAKISFETYGCAAAIATSSMTTDLALHKSLSDALALTKADVIKGLTDLPPQKVHCSVLAIDALGEAIYNFYLGKSLPIPPDLQKRHRRIQKAQEVLRQRYEEWTKKK